jgi:4-hydroxyphenylacetate degradation bifunctional isomerase/decarboxylase decarboxylase subunit
MFALGLNYADHAAELAFKAPTEPLAFIKSKGTYTGHNQVTWRPDNVAYMHYECELVAVIGKPARNVKRADALDYLAGYTVCNDYAIRDYLENYYRPNLRVKNRDATTPVGPWIVDAADVPTPQAEAAHLGQRRTAQEGSTADMIFDIPYLIEYLSSFMTLQPGDMIATGTPKAWPTWCRAMKWWWKSKASAAWSTASSARPSSSPRASKRRGRTMIKHWINGREVESKAVFINYNPATGEAIGEVASGGAEEIAGRGGGQGSLPEVGQHPGQGTRQADAQAGRADRPERAAPGRAGNPRHRPADPPDQATC